jgi:hypothetical protein
MFGHRVYKNRAMTRFLEDARYNRNCTCWDRDCLPDSCYHLADGRATGCYCRVWAEDVAAQH